MAVAAAFKYPSVEIDTGDHTPIAEDEVVFILRAQDKMSVPTLECYYELCVAAESPPEHLAAIVQSIEQMRAWQQDHEESVGIPD